jgi:hypothetical protein
MNSEWSTDVSFGTNFGLTSDITVLPKVPIATFVALVPVPLGGSLHYPLAI